MEESTRIPITELQNTQEYQRLTPKQRMFVASYCQMGLDTGTYDPVAATQMAYKCRNYETARVMSYDLLSNIRVIAVLNLHFNRQPIEEFLLTLDRAIGSRKVTAAQIQALRLKAYLMGFMTRLPTSAEPYKVIIAPEVITRDQADRKKHRKKREAKPRGAETPAAHSQIAKQISGSKI